MPASSEVPETARRVTRTALEKSADDASIHCFRILVATDNHIGYAERDPVRGQDSINTFREILELAKSRKVDFILLAGDLFHENRPSRTCMHQTIALLREYTLGDKEIAFELMSDPMEGSTPGFSFPAVNYEDPNLNIAIPVFSIHGNHDDPQGTGPEGALCALDVLSVSGLLNYFGKVDLSADDNNANEDPDKGIRIKPVLLRKGESYLGLYGVGNVKDARMHYELRSNRVKMYMPAGGDVADDNWFNILLVHQNRVKHGPQQSVPEGMFDDSINLVIWGHEHDCRITPESVPGKGYFISQPGSSIATSLMPGEALPKRVGLLSVQGSSFALEEIPLKTVRPFEMDDVVLSYAAEHGSCALDDRDSITAYLRTEVEALIEKAKTTWKERNGSGKKEMMLPLIRLKVETSDAKEMTNPVRFGQDFIGRVANPKDILQYYRRKKAPERKAKNVPDAPDEESDESQDDGAGATVNERLNKMHMDDVVHKYLGNQHLEVLARNGLEDAVMRFVEKDDRDAIRDFVTQSMRRQTKSASTREGTGNDEADLEDAILESREQAEAHWEAHRPVSKQKGRKKEAAKDSDVDSMAAEDDEPMEVDSDVSSEAPKKKAPAKRGAKAPAKAAAKAPPKGKGKKAKEALFIADESGEEEEEEEVVPVPKKRGKASAPAASSSKTARAPAKTPAKAPAKRGAASKSAGMTQSQLTFSRAGTGKPSKYIVLSEDE
ncbi:DNA repair protein (mre11) [Cryptococcus sp. DSM 104549]